ncbi:MAG: signal peptidase I [Pyrinomonadaceae bacterium]|nr:signal peptidase I [Pyrinomonadaceae bacterium]
MDDKTDKKVKHSEQDEKIKKPVGPPKGIFREYFESLVVTLIMAIFGMTFIIQAVTVPTGSMQNTILVGDYLLVNKFIFAPGGTPIPFLPQREIRRGDIIVFKYPGFPDNKAKTMDEGGVPYQINFVKRVIGLPGDKIEFRENSVYINDQLLPEHRIIGDPPENIPRTLRNVSALETREIEPRQPEQKYDVFYSKNAFDEDVLPSEYPFASAGKPYVVPQGSYFVMGDSRNSSLDSRYWGVVDRNLVIGQAMFVYWSCDRVASGESMLGCITNPRLNRIGKMIK